MAGLPLVDKEKRAAVWKGERFGVPVARYLHVEPAGAAEKIRLQESSPCTRSWL